MGTSAHFGKRVRNSISIYCRIHEMSCILIPSVQVNLKTAKYYKTNLNSNWIAVTVASLWSVISRAGYQTTALSWYQPKCVHNSEYQKLPSTNGDMDCLVRFVTLKHECETADQTWRRWWGMGKMLFWLQTGHFPSIHLQCFGFVFGKLPP